MSAGKKLISPPMQMFTEKKFFCRNRLFHTFDHCIVGSALVPLCCLPKSSRLCSQGTAHKKHTTSLSLVHHCKTFPTSTVSAPAASHKLDCTTSPRLAQLQLLAVSLANQDHSSVPAGMTAFPVKDEEAQGCHEACLALASTSSMLFIFHTDLFFFPERPSTEQELLRLTLLVSH